jgi:hypothetical protein
VGIAGKLSIIKTQFTLNLSALSPDCAHYRDIQLTIIASCDAAFVVQFRQVLFHLMKRFDGGGIREIDTRTYNLKEGGENGSIKRPAARALGADELRANHSYGVRRETPAP